MLIGYAIKKSRQHHLVLISPLLEMGSDPLPRDVDVVPGSCLGLISWAIIVGIVRLLLITIITCTRENGQAELTQTRANDAATAFYTLCYSLYLENYKVRDNSRLCTKFLLPCLCRNCDRTVSVYFISQGGGRGKTSASEFGLRNKGWSLPGPYLFIKSNMLRDVIQSHRLFAASKVTLDYLSSV